MILDCLICLDGESGPFVVTPCGHLYHLECIKRWFQTETPNYHTCPAHCPECHSPCTLDGCIRVYEQGHSLPPAEHTEKPATSTTTTTLVHACPPPSPFDSPFGTDFHDSPSLSPSIDESSQESPASSLSPSPLLDGHGSDVSMRSSTSPLEEGEREEDMDRDEGEEDSTDDDASDAPVGYSTQPSTTSALPSAVRDALAGPVRDILGRVRASLRDPAEVTSALMKLYNLVKTGTGSSVTVSEEGGIALLVDCMREHKEDTRVLEWVTLTLVPLSDPPPNRITMRDLGVQGIVEEAVSTHPDSAMSKDLRWLRENLQ
ncbi:hypothetical protein KIPB_004381 [Kipferlia bialata]|uniref:RING-type E3 ubiquitin transferase n=1 Tax=Kipferlia bialata TaxID=797122 RepID=A0A9K3CUF3_9EUKA|nr:hypothetical protein KIPB_004381 [Kipferlia bialata]|eukprot:g4381.t1